MVQSFDGIVIILSIGVIFLYNVVVFDGDLHLR